MKSNYKNGFVVIFTFVALVLFVVAIYQFVTIANLNQQQANLLVEYELKQEEQSQYQNQLSNYQDNDERYVEDYAKENLNMKNSEETVYEG